jgi:hypothetical protein
MEQRTDVSAILAVEDRADKLLATLRHVQGRRAGSAATTRLLGASLDSSRLTASTGLTAYSRGVGALTDLATCKKR